MNKTILNTARTWKVDRKIPSFGWLTSYRPNGTQRHRVKIRLSKHRRS